MIMVNRKFWIFLRSLRLIRKILASVAGLILSIVLYLGAISLIIDYVGEFSGLGSNVFLDLVCFLVMPLAFLLGGFLTGCLIADIIRRVITEAVLFSPGLWASVSIMVVSCQLYPFIIKEIAIMSGVLIAVSFIGVLLGIATGTRFR